MKNIIPGIVVTVIGGLILWGIQSFFTSNDNFPITSASHQNAVLTISATNSGVEIHESKSQIPYNGGIIAATNSDQIVFLPKGQLLTVNLTGTNSDLKIAKSIADQVLVNNTGTNSDVILF